MGSYLFILFSLIIILAIFSIGLNLFAKKLNLDNTSLGLNKKTPVLSSFKYGCILLIFCSSCGAKQNNQTTGEYIPIEDEKYTVVKTLFGTDRNTVFDSEKIKFGVERDTLKYGICNVSIPFSHKVGEIESPKWWRFEFNEDPEKHVVIQGRFLRSKEDFFSKESESKKARLFLFIHGFNVSFDEAAKRTAQMAYDMSFDGIPMFYSWPSKSKTGAYIEDGDNIEYSTPHIVTFINEIIENYPTHEINLIGHSMGTRGLTKALVEIYDKNPIAASKINQVILAAPDIDAEVFKRNIAPKIAKNSKSITLYASSNDLALKSSKELRGGRSRAGDSGKDLVIVDGIETIDATNLDTGFLGHSYFGSSRPVISDIDNLLDHGKMAGQRSGLTVVVKEHKEYWTFKK